MKITASWSGALSEQSFRLVYIGMIPSKGVFGVAGMATTIFSTSGDTADANGNALYTVVCVKPTHFTDIGSTTVLCIQ